MHIILLFSPPWNIIYMVVIKMPVQLTDLLLDIYIDVKGGPKIMS